jgi:hypothetical protein
VNAPEMCWVDGCDRRAAASVATDDLPGRVSLCLTYTEGFRMNGERWIFQWVPGSAAPSLVAPAPLLAVARTFGHCRLAGGPGDAWRPSEGPPYGVAARALVGRNARGSARPTLSGRSEAPCSSGSDP